MIDGAPALTMDSVCPCKFGGIISIVDMTETEPKMAMDALERGAVGAAIISAAVPSKKTVSVMNEPAFAEIEMETGTLDKVPDNGNTVRKTQKMAKPRKV